MQQIPMLLPDSSWRPPELSTLPDWGDAERVCLDVETYDPHLKETGPSVRTGGHLVGVCVGIENGPRMYLPFGHREGDNLPEENVMRYIREQCKKYRGEIVGANLAYDLDWLWAAGVQMPDIKGYRDVLLAEPCLDENKKFYSLDHVSNRWLGEQKEKTLMYEAALAYGMKNKRDLGKFIHLLPARFVGPYGEADADLPLRVLREQEKEIERQNLNKVFDLECKVLPVAVKMRQRGVRVDQDRLLEVEVRAQKERVAASEIISKESGVAIGPDDDMKKELLVKALQNIGHQITIDDPLDKGFIKQHQEHCKVVEALGKLRKWSTLRKLSIDPVKKHLHKGRIHCTFNQMAMDDGEGGRKGARYGRLSCEHVNMQQQPSRDEDIAPIWRRIYLPDEGKLWAANDYSQQEPRMLVHWADLVASLGIKPMRGAAEMAERYRQDPKADNHDMMARIVYGEDVVRSADKAAYKKMRSDCKIIFLGLIYGMGGPKLCSDLGLPTKVVEIERGRRAGQRYLAAGDAAQAIIDKVHTKLPFLKEMSDLCAERGSKNGFITTLSGRRCRFPLSSDGLNYWDTHKGLNRLVQGSSGDQTKEAMVAADAEGFPLQLQIHDELGLSVEHVDEAKELAILMENCVDLRVPSHVDVEIGTSWGEAK